MIALIELIGIFSLVLGWGFWELYSLRRDKKRRAETQAGKSDPA